MKKQIITLKILATVYIMAFALLGSYIPTYLTDLAIWGVIMSLAFLAVPNDYTPAEYTEEYVQ